MIGGDQGKRTLSLKPVRGGTAVVDSRGRTQGMLADDAAREGGAA